jgi:hypothetical protein
MHEASKYIEHTRQLTKKSRCHLLLNYVLMLNQCPLMVSQNPSGGV